MLQSISCPYVNTRSSSTVAQGSNVCLNYRQFRNAWNHFILVYHSITKLKVRSCGNQRHLMFLWRVYTSRADSMYVETCLPYSNPCMFHRKSTTWCRHHQYQLCPHLPVHGQALQFRIQNSLPRSVTINGSVRNKSMIRNSLKVRMPTTSARQR